MTPPIEKLEILLSEIEQKIEDDDDFSSGDEFDSLYEELNIKLENDFRCKDQVKTDFWKPEGGWMKRIIPDIVVSDFNDKSVAIVDTKWKNIYKDCLNSTLVYLTSE